MKAYAWKNGEGETRLTLDLTVPEALAFARFLGRMSSEAARAFGLDGGEYDDLADALEHGEHAPFPYDTCDFGNGLYAALQKLPRVNHLLNDATPKEVI